MAAVNAVMAGAERSGRQAVVLVQVLPYHRMGSIKYARLHRRDPMPPTEAPSTADIERHVSCLEGLGLPVSVH